MDDVQLGLLEPNAALMVSGRFTPDLDGTIVTSQLRMAGRTSHAYVYPPDWDTDQWPPEPHQQVRAGHAMALMNDVWPLCDGQAHLPARLDLTYQRPNGQPADQSFAVVIAGQSEADTEHVIAEATDKICADPVKVLGPSVSVDSDRERTWRNYRIVNIGTVDATVTSRAWSSGGAEWLEASTEVPADGQEHQLKVHGQGVCDLHGPDDPESLGLFEVTMADGTVHQIPPSGHGGYACSV